MFFTNYIFHQNISYVKTNFVHQFLTKKKVNYNNKDGTLYFQFDMYQ